MEKPFGLIPPWLFPRQADRKAGPGETAWRGSNKPKPIRNGSDMPTSIWSFVVRKSMEPFLLRNANDNRRPSIGASQTRHKDCRACRPLISMTKVDSGPKRFPRRACPTGTPSTEWCPLKGLSRVKGNFHARFLGGRGRVNRPRLPGARQRDSPTRELSKPM